MKVRHEWFYAKPYIPLAILAFLCITNALFLSSVLQSGIKLEFTWQTAFLLSPALVGYPVSAILVRSLILGMRKGKISI